MPNYINFLISLFLLSFALASPAQASYTMTELVATPLDVPDTVNDVVWDNTDTAYPNDDDKQTVNIGFPFQFDNIIYNDVTILTNGILKFGAVERMHRDWKNEALDTDEGDRIIAVYWDDLVEDGSASVTYGNIGAAPNRQFVVNWTNVRAYSNNLRYDFQVVLYENGDIRYRYNNNTANGQSATIGLEIDDSDFVQYSYNSISIEVSFDLLFRNQLLALPPPIAQYRFDEVTWSSNIDEVIDSALNPKHGRSFSGAITSDLSPVLGANIGTCNYGAFDGINDYIEVSDDNKLDFDNDFSIGAWVKIDVIPTSGLNTILSKSENYGIHINTSGQVNWWWRTSGSSQVREFNSTASVPSGVWTHIAISHETGNQKIYINGIESGSASYGENLETNNGPLWIAADPGNSSRYFNGDIDEINIFDEPLISFQVLELMDNTRPCSSINLCVTSFPDGLNSHSDGIIKFGKNSQLFFSPDDILEAQSVDIDGSSSKRSCVSLDCQVSGLSAELATEPTFPNTSGFSSSLSVGNNNDVVTDSSINEFDQITIGDNSSLAFSAASDDVYIDSITIGNDSELSFLPGNYWIRNITDNSTSGIQISVAGAGTARLFILEDVDFAKSLLANSIAHGTQGDANKLFIYGYGDIEINRDSTYSGIIYAADDINVKKNSYVYGALTGKDVELGNNTKVYFFPSATVSLDFGALCQLASCTLGSFNISQPDYALACPGSRSQVSIQALCEDGTSIKDDYAGTVDLTSSENALSEFYSSLVSVSPIDSIVFDGSESGLKDVYLFHQNENPALQVIATDAAIAVVSTSSNPTDFGTSGFSITNPSSFICGNSGSMSLTAVGEDASGATCQTLSGFTGTKGFKVWYTVNVDAVAAADPVTTSFSIASQAINDQSEPAENNINLAFNNGIASIPLAYENSGQVLGINFKHDDAPYDNSVPALSGITLNATTSAFVIKPDKIHLAITSADSACASANASCSKFVAAGSPFGLIAEAQCVGGGIADDYQGSINLTHNLVAPLPGNTGSLSVTSATIAAVDSGSLNITSQSISEVGVFAITSDAGQYYGEDISLFTLSDIGRFYPNNFVMISNSTTNSCGSFSYMGQTDSEIDISYTLQAKNLGGNTTLNYKDTFAKASMALVAENNNDGGGYQARLVNFANTNWANGEYIYSDGGHFSRASLVDGPYQVLQVGAQLNDNDGNTSSLAGLDMKADTTSDCVSLANCDAKLIGTLDIRFGQLTLSNVFGPETVSLDMSVQTEYFNGTDFILNTDDDCTKLEVSDPPLTAKVGADSWTDNLDVNETTPSLNTDITSGVGIIRFSAAGLGNEGSVIFRYSADSWLRTENNGDASYDDDALGKVTFGQFRGNDRMIYWQEIVR